MKRAVSLLAFFTFILTVAAQSALATDLTIDTIYSPTGQIVKGKSTDIRLRIRNINRLLADVYTVDISILKDGNSTPVYTHTINAINLPAYTDTIFRLTNAWTPTDSGAYSIVARVNYAEDIDHSNDQHTGRFEVVQKPDVTVTVSQVVNFSPTRDSITDYGMVSMSISPTIHVKFINVVFRTSERSDSVWLVQNILVLPSDRTDELPLKTWIDFHRLGIPRGSFVDSLYMCVYVTDTPMTVPPPVGATCEWYHLGRASYLVGPGATVDSLIVHSPDVFDSVHASTFVPHEPVVYDSVERGCTVPNVDLDSVHYNPTTDTTYAGDWNACGPAAAGNSIQWLENSDPRIRTNTNLREKIHELSKLMGRLKWDKGVTTQQLIRGKLAFIDKYKLPIRVKYKSMWDTSDIRTATGTGHTGGSKTKATPYGKRWAPDWNWIVQEMKDSEDVEMMVGWYDTVRRGGHWFVLTGTHTINGVHRFSFKDDSAQAVSGGTERVVMTYDTTSTGWPYIPEWSAYRRCFIESVVSESVDSTITFPATRVAPEHDIGLRLAVDVVAPRGLEIRYSVPQPGIYSLTLYDILGKLVATIFEDKLLTQPTVLRWTSTLPSGAYFLALDGEAGRSSIRVVIP